MTEIDLTGATRPEVAGPSNETPWWRRRLGRIAAAGVVVVLSLLVVVADATFLGDMLRAGGSRLAVGVTTEDVAGKAVFLGIVCWLAAIPGLLLLRLAGRRAGVAGAWLVVAAGMAAMLVGINGGRIQGLIFPPFSLAGGFDWDGLLLTPIVEELLKGVAVVAVMLVAGTRSVRAGILLGAAAGLGMTAFETAHFIVVYYLLQDGPWFGTVIALRFAVLGLGMHATATALTGLGLGAWMERGGRRRGAWMILAGLAGAIGVHVLWNAVGTDLMIRIYRPMATPGQVQQPIESFIASSIASVVLLVIPWIALAVAWRRSGRSTTGPLVPVP